MFFAILSFMIAGDVVWWRLADRLARRTRRPVLWRTTAAAFVAALAGCMVVILVARLTRTRAQVLPDVVVMAVFIWHFILMPAFLLPVGTAFLVVRGWRMVRRRGGSAHDAERPESAARAAGGAAVSPAGQAESAARAAASLRPDVAPVLSSRRAFLSAAVVAMPPLATAALVGVARAEEDQLRLREFELPIPGLPDALVGMTIAHVTDPHVASFITPAKIERIVEMTNAIDADLVLQTGDLINASLGDLPAAIDMARRLRGRYGVYHVQGNHDCIEDRSAFERDTVRAGLNMLLDASEVVRVRGHRVNLVGPRWWGGDADVLDWSVREPLAAGPSDAFPIVMVHHPHGFDAAAARGVPLTLAGHTHGGQLALSRNVGVGPLMYRYWSGVYTKGNSTAVVSNGTGNWFPLRINVPCEILKLTLRRA